MVFWILRSYPRVCSYERWFFKGSLVKIMILCRTMNTQRTICMLKRFFAWFFRRFLMETADFSILYIAPQILLNNIMSNRILISLLSFIVFCDGLNFVVNDYLLFKAHINKQLTTFSSDFSKAVNDTTGFILKTHKKYYNLEIGRAHV